MIACRYQTSYIGAGLVGRWAIPPGPKLKNWRGAKKHPQIWAHLGSVAIFEKFKVLSLGIVAHFWILVSAPFRLQLALLL
jgi:hypothetical protein